MMAHTKGPWKIRKSTDVDGDTWENIESETHTICMMTGGTGDDEGNSSVVVAAPDLLEALQSLTERYIVLAASGDCGHWNPEEEKVIIRAKAAIAKAKGEVSNG